MINILSIRCGLGFGPFLADAAAEFLSEGAAAPRVVKQGGNGLIIRSEESLYVRHQNRESALDGRAARHYAATVGFRAGVFDIRRTREEVVLATVGDDILISFPQSEMWLGRPAVASLIEAFGEQSGDPAQSDLLPDWLKVSTCGGRLLLSDQRNGRWILLGEDHILELSRRLDSVGAVGPAARRAPPPTVTVKGMAIHVQSAFKLAEVFEAFSAGGEVAEYEEATPEYLLGVRRSTEGVEIRDFDKRVGVTAREARKWAEILRHELGKLGAGQVERGPIRTVAADGSGGRWVMQWGDQVFIPEESISAIGGTGDGAVGIAGGLAAGRADGYLLLLDAQTGGCVALEGAEIGLIGDKRAGAD